MNTRHISLIVVIQSLALVCLLLIASVAAKLAPTLTLATNLRDYGILGFILIILWVLVALHSYKSASKGYSLGTSVIGISFILFLLFSGVILLTQGMLWSFPSKPASLIEMKEGK